MASISSSAPGRLNRERPRPQVAPLRDAAIDRAIPGTLMLAPVALALILVEASDLMFAVDSIPAIVAITADLCLVFTSNVFAILGLRSLNFALAADLIDTFRFLKVSVAMVFAIVGLKYVAGRATEGRVRARVQHLSLTLCSSSSASLSWRPCARSRHSSVRNWWGRTGVAQRSHRLLDMAIDVGMASALGIVR